MSQAEPIVLETERLYVRPWRESDVDPMRALFTDPEAVRYLLDGKPWSEEQIAELVRFNIDQRSGWEPGLFNCPLVLRDGDVVVGRVGINPLWDEHGNVDYGEPELEWDLIRSYWGRGLATEAGRALLDYGFNVAGFDHLIAFAVPENKASLRVMEKIGMHYWKTAPFRNKIFTFYRLERPAG